MSGKNGNGKRERKNGSEKKAIGKKGSRKKEFGKRANHLGTCM
jgi:hypothetical protein